MREYTVTLSIEGVAIVRVEAEDEDSALEKAREEWDRGDIRSSNVDDSKSHHIEDMGEIEQDEEEES